MNIKILKVGLLETNCYLIFNDSKETMIVDPGEETDFITETIIRYSLKPKLIVATHGHFDHILVSGELSLIYKLPLFIHSDDLFLVKEMNKLASFWLRTKSFYPLPQKFNFLKNGQEIKIGKEKFEAILTPGHTPGSISLWNKKNSLIFSGDLIFKEGLGRTDFSYSNKEAFRKSIKRIFSLSKKIKFYPGHGPSFVVERK